ncbi:hypothetical protein DFH08DRAFT_818614 [Mycena albidolilacea]|uniref:Uncharacterized protein n=1 Tax=Mycena albidolilacea TaxID=1033008 RepID=A0AAD7EFN5_9AGAR|nr:hypothetical protein DFH08DRAFT_818614 [Mycena albidolilacea]
MFSKLPRTVGLQQSAVMLKIAGNRRSPMILSVPVLLSEHSVTHAWQNRPRPAVLDGPTPLQKPPETGGPQRSDPSQKPPETGDHQWSSALRKFAGDHRFSTVNATLKNRQRPVASVGQVKSKKPPKTGGPQRSSP